MRLQFSYFAEGSVTASSLGTGKWKSRKYIYQKNITTRSKNALFLNSQQQNLLGFWGEKSHRGFPAPAPYRIRQLFLIRLTDTYCIYPHMGESPITLFIPRQVCILVRNSQHTSLLHRLARLALPAGARPDYVCEAVNYAAFAGSAADRHRGGPGPLPLHSGAQRSEGLCFTFTNEKECDCRLAQPQDVRGKQETIINLRLPSNSGHQTEFLPDIFPPSLSLVIQFLTLFSDFIYLFIFLSRCCNINFLI